MKIVTTIFGLILGIASTVALDVDEHGEQQFPISAHGCVGPACVEPSMLPLQLLPYTEEWLHLLESIYNAFGHRNWTSDDQPCPVPLPAFDCEPYYWEDNNPGRERDARHLRPQDIRAVIALGDSITAGFGMLSGRPPFASVLEYRGKTFATGADDGEYSIPNFLSIYTKATGGPEGVTVPMSRGKGLNNAISGAKIQDLKDEVARLTYLLNTHRYQPIKDEWKLITIFVGANNICVLCTPPMTGLPILAHADEFERHMRQVLDTLRTNVGKSFVNLVGLFNVSAVYEASRGDSYCEFVLDPTHMVICSCIQADDAQRQAADEMVMEYNARLEMLAAEYNALDDPQFAVGYQPGFTNFDIAKYKQGYLSGLDCFHPNLCANRAMALALWNNMFSTAEEKKEPFDMDNLYVRCPSPSRPYIQ